jgi:CBS domain-containing protein
MIPTSHRLVRDLMTVGVPTCAPDALLTDLARLSLEKGVEAFVVMKDGHALGVISERELVASSTQEDAHSLTAEQVMREGVPQVPPDIPLSAAALLMGDLGVQTLFLMHHAGGIEYPAAYISYRHYLRLLAAESDDELSDLGIYADRQPPLQEFIQRRDEARRRAGGSTQ